MDKAVHFQLEATIEDGSSINVHLAVLPLIIPGVVLKTFPIVSDVVSVGKPVLRKIVGTDKGIPTKPFLGMGTRLWKACLENACSRERHSFVAGKRKIPCGIVDEHTLRRHVPQLPPVCVRGEGNSVQCQYCKKKFTLEKDYIRACVPEFEPAES